jgi:hypothetical protein
VRKPPISGPTIDPKPKTIENTIEIFGRSSMVYMSATIVCATGSTQPAPTPCIARNRMSSTIEPAEPQSTEPTRKMINPARKIRLRPYMSAKRPQRGMVAISASRYAVNTQA